MISYAAAFIFAAIAFACGFVLAALLGANGDDD